MKNILFFIGFLSLISEAQTVSAISLDKVGIGTEPIWTQICSMLPYCGGGVNGLLVITSIVINTVLWAIGSAAVVVILYASLRIVTSGGNEEIVRKAWKETVLYACLGLLFAVLADTIVNYVIQFVSLVVS